MLIALPLLAAAPARAQTIPPGREAVLATMLGSGAPLPGDCAFTDGQVGREVVRATYRCADGDVQLLLAHPSARTAPVLTTERFSVAVASGSPPAGLLAALEARIRARESGFEWTMLTIGKDGQRFAVAPGVPTWLSVLLLSALAGASAVSARRAWASRTAVGRRATIEALVVAASVVLWLQIAAAPPAHMDTAVDVALARDCIASGGAACLGHASSAIGLVQGQGFTYALALWLSLGLSMRALCFVAACTVGAAVGLLHHALARRFGGVAWVASALASGLAVSMTGYPTIWNPSWFVLPLTVAFVATLALAAGGGVWNAFVAGVAFALTSESHLLFGAFVGVAVLLVALTARAALAATSVLLATFVLVELVVSPVSFAQNAFVLRGWLGAHLVPATGAVLLVGASLPLQRRVRRALRGDPETRERTVVVAWMLAGAVGLGLVLPWAVSRPPQIRYYGAAFPAIGYAVAWLLDAVTLRARSRTLRVAAVLIFAGTCALRTATADFATPGWFMDDAREIATHAGLAETSALDVQLMIRPIPEGALSPVAAAFVGTAAAPAFPTRIVRAVLPGPDAELPAGWRRLRLARREVFLSDLDAWTRPEEAAICPDPGNGDPCMTLTRDDFRDVARSTGGLLHRVFGVRIDRSADRIGAWMAGGTRSLLWKIPLHPAGPDASREVVFPDATDVAIVAVEGTRGTLRRDNHAVVERPAADAAASITVRTPIAGRFEAGLPPLPFELHEREIAVGGRHIAVLP